MMNTTDSIQKALRSDDLYQLDQWMDDYRQDHDVDFYTVRIATSGEYAIMVYDMDTEQDLGYMTDLH